MCSLKLPCKLKFTHLLPKKIFLNAILYIKDRCVFKGINYMDGKKFDDLSAPFCGAAVSAYWLFNALSAPLRGAALSKYWLFDALSAPAKGARQNGSNFNFRKF